MNASQGGKYCHIQGRNEMQQKIRIALLTSTCEFGANALISLEGSFARLVFQAPEDTVRCT